MIKFEKYYIDKVNYEFDYDNTISQEDLNFKLKGKMTIFKDSNYVLATFIPELFDTYKSFSISTSIKFVYKITDEDIITERNLSSLTNAVFSISFPFIRSCIADLTKTINVFSPVILPIINVTAYFNKNKDSFEISVI